MDKGTISHEKLFRIHLSSIVASELLDAPWAQNQPDAKAIADLCVSQAASALNRTACESRDVMATTDKISALNPQLEQHIAKAILQASILIHRSLMKPYAQMKTN